ncbi:hypothetical protein Hdeb2414_s0018g00524181 [Helianthus debilis subsp. tardiflorus]
MNTIETETRRCIPTKYFPAFTTLLFIQHIEQFLLTIYVVINFALQQEYDGVGIQRKRLQCTTFWHQQQKRTKATTIVQKKKQHKKDFDVKKIKL